MIFLQTTHTTFLTVITGFTRDPFQGAVDSWTARRRASRLAAQQSGHHRWEAAHATSFFAYWGHAARYSAHESIPVVLALRIRGPEWLFANAHLSPRCKPGRCPDFSRFIQLAWEAYLSSRGTSAVTSWIREAAQRDQWREFSQDWLLRKIVVLHATTPVIRRRSISVVDNCFRMENFSHSCRSDMSRLNPLMRSPTSGLITKGKCVWLIPPSLNICCVSIRTGVPASIVDSMVVEEPPWWFCRPTQ